MTPTPSPRVIRGYYTVLGNVNQITMDSSGVLYIADQFSGGNNKGALKSYDRSTGVFKTLAYGLNQPLGVAIGAAGAIFVSDSSSGLIKSWTSAGGAILTTIAFGGGLSVPASLAYNPNSGNLYISDPGFNSHSGRVVYWHSSFGTTVQQLFTGNVPGLYLDAGYANLLYVVKNTGNVMNYQLSNGGTSTRLSGVVTNAQGVAVDASGNVYVAAAGSGFTATSGSLWRAGGTVVSPLNQPKNMVVDTSGNAYFINFYGPTEVRKYTVSSSSASAVFTGAGTGGSNLNTPSYFSLDPSSNVWMCNSLGSTTHRINNIASATPTFTGMYTTTSCGSNGGSYAFDASGKLYTMLGSSAANPVFSAVNGGSLSSIGACSGCDTPCAPGCIAVNSAGTRVWFAASFGATLFTFSAGSWTRIPQSGSYWTLTQLQVDASNNVYGVQGGSGGSAIVAITAASSWVTSVTIVPAASQPPSIALAPDGTLYVCTLSTASNLNSQFAANTKTATLYAYTSSDGTPTGTWTSRVIVQPYILYDGCAMDVDASGTLYIWDKSGTVYKY